MPLRDRDDRSRALGVLALACDRPFDRAERERAVLLADRLAGLLARPQGNRPTIRFAAVTLAASVQALRPQ